MSSGNIDSKSFINLFGGDKRRTSQASGSAAGGASPTFKNLNHQKRSSLDASTQARRSSIDDQYAPKGIIGSMWHSFTKGSK